MKHADIMRAVLLAATVVSTIGCDQATKHMARTHLEGAAPLSFLGGAVRLTLAQNEGGFLSLGASLPHGARATVFLLGVAGGLLLAAVYLVRSTHLGFTGRLCAWLLWAGGLSNLVDRVLFEGRVTDFLIVGLGPLRTGVFNIADVAIMAGGALLILSAWGGPPTNDAAASRERTQT